MTEQSKKFWLSRIPVTLVINNWYQNIDFSMFIITPSLKEISSQASQCKQILNVFEISQQVSLILLYWLKPLNDEVWEETGVPEENP